MSNNSVFFTSDLHLGHENIIEYCDRQFSSVEEMDSTLIGNWNDTVSPEDTVYFLGDLTIKRGQYWHLLNLLNGNKILIKGNHDPQGLGIPHMIIKMFQGIPLLFVHNPIDILPGFDGWTIHGHQHNSTPFLNADERRINVSVENTDYCPVSMTEIIHSILK